jgi:carbon-monoxide dehydrogenase medium subunit
LSGVADAPRRAVAAESLLDGRAIDAAAVEEAVASIRASVEPNRDLHASEDYRRHLVGVLAARAMATAWQRALGAAA